MTSGSATKALWERIAQMKEMLGEWPRENGTVASWEKHTVGEIQVQRSLLEIYGKFFEDKFVGLKVEIQSLIDDFKGFLQSYGEEIAVLKKVVLQGCSSGPKAPPKVRVLEPKGSNGNRNAKELENFLWDMEQFFRVAHVPDGEKVSITDQFLHTNIAWVARESLKMLRHTGSVRDYVKEFSSLMLDMKNMLEKDKLFNFMFGLQCRLLGGLQDGWRHLHHAETKLEGSKKAKAKGKTSKKSGWKKQNKKGAAGTLVDSGATHNFVATKEANRLGLKLENDTSRIKAANIKAQKIQGVAKNVLMQVALIEIKEGQFMEVPNSVVKILKEFRDVMPAQLPKKLPPRRLIDRKIELLPRTKPPTQAPYRMSPAELLELRK
ncbi:hypothetical protein CK203_087390 [Vitis vinifera]|uniref:Uncharacterized protein n=1 Tax=Vitis vinifera TaxID=29760 RepID=A0A438D2Y6_VITVI|nr:hypothetical protein CK203_087390 [Vitis vinifera]